MKMSNASKEMNEMEMIRMVNNYTKDVGRSNGIDVEVADFIRRIFKGDDVEVVNDRDRQVQGIDIVVRKGNVNINVDTKNPSSRRGYETVVVPWERTISYDNGRVVNAPQDWFNERAKTHFVVKVFNDGTHWNFDIFKFRGTRKFIESNEDDIKGKFGVRNVRQERRNGVQVTKASFVPASYFHGTECHAGTVRVKVRD